MMKNRQWILDEYIPMTEMIIRDNLFISRYMKIAIYANNKSNTCFWRIQRIIFVSFVVKKKKACLSISCKLFITANHKIRPNKKKPQNTLVFESFFSILF